MTRLLRPTSMTMESWLRSTRVTLQSQAIRCTDVDAEEDAYRINTEVTTTIAITSPAKGATARV